MRIGRAGRCPIREGEARPEGGATVAATWAGVWRWGSKLYVRMATLYQWVVSLLPKLHKMANKNHE